VVAHALADLALDDELDAIEDERPGEG